jgi:hypothetical protein
MHQFRSANDGLHGAGLDAHHASNTDGLVNLRQCSCFVQAKYRVQRLANDSGYGRETTYRGVVAGWALVDICAAIRNRPGVLPATGITAFRTLGLRQPRIYLCDPVFTISGFHELVWCNE